MRCKEIVQEEECKKGRKIRNHDPVPYQDQKIGQEKDCLFKGKSCSIELPDTIG